MSFPLGCVDFYVGVGGLYFGVIVFLSLRCGFVWWYCYGIDLLLNALVALVFFGFGWIDSYGY